MYGYMTLTELIPRCLRYKTRMSRCSWRPRLIKVGRWQLANANQSAEGAGGLGIIRSNKIGETE